MKKHKEAHGYIIDDKEIKEKTTIITTPFADDFNLISRNKKQHQALLSDVEEKAKSMGLIFKPKKCRSLSISSGRVENVSFVLSDPNDNNLKTHIQTTHEKPHKFLGSQVTKSNSPNDYFQYLKKALEQKKEKNT